MLHTMYLDERVVLTPTELNTIHEMKDLRETIHGKLAKKHENKCNANGFVLPKTLEILARSDGIAENGRFTGNFMYDCKFKCDVLYPTAESEVSAFVLKVNKMGAYAHHMNAIRILLPRESHVENAAFDAIQEGSEITVRIERSRFQTNELYIMSVGTLVSARGAQKTVRGPVEGALEEPPSEEGSGPESDEGSGSASAAVEGVLDEASGAEGSAAEEEAAPLPPSGSSATTEPGASAEVRTVTGADAADADEGTVKTLTVHGPPTKQSRTKKPQLSAEELEKAAKEKEEKAAAAKVERAAKAKAAREEKAAKAKAEKEAAKEAAKAKADAVAAEAAALLLPADNV